MIRSTAVNRIVAVAGGALALYGVLSWIAVVREGGALVKPWSYEGLASLTFLGLGLWCLFGTASNLRKLQGTSSVESRFWPSGFIRLLVRGVAVTGVGAAVSYLLGRGRVLILMYYVLAALLCLIATILVALAVSSSGAGLSGRPAGRR
jgi:hypothetical protein